MFKSYPHKQICLKICLKFDLIFFKKSVNSLKYFLILLVYIYIFYNDKITNNIRNRSNKQ